MKSKISSSRIHGPTTTNTKSNGPPIKSPGSLMDKLVVSRSAQTHGTPHPTNGTSPKLPLVSNSPFGLVVSQLTAKVQSSGLVESSTGTLKISRTTATTTPVSNPSISSATMLRPPWEPTTASR